MLLICSWPWVRSRPLAQRSWGHSDSRCGSATLCPLNFSVKILLKHMHCEMTGRYRRNRSILACGLLQTSCLQIFFKAPEDRTISPHLCTEFMVHSMPSLTGNQIFSARNFGFQINNTRSKGEWRLKKKGSLCSFWDLSFLTGSNPCPLQWKHGVLSLGCQGSPEIF